MHPLQRRWVIPAQLRWEAQFATTYHMIIIIIENQRTTLEAYMAT